MQLQVIGTIPGCTLCGKDAVVLLFKQDTPGSDDINLFLLCQQHLEELGQMVRQQIAIPDVFKNALAEEG